MHGTEQLYLYLADFFDLTQTARGAELLEQAGNDYYRISADHRGREAAWKRAAWERLARACAEDRMVPGNQGVMELPADGEDAPDLRIFSTHWNIPAAVGDLCYEHLRSTEGAALETEGARKAIKKLRAWLLAEARGHLGQAPHQQDGPRQSRMFVVSLRIGDEPLNPLHAEGADWKRLPGEDRFTITMIELCNAHDYARPEFPTAPASLLNVPSSEPLHVWPKFMDELRSNRGKHRVEQDRAWLWVRSAVSMYRARIAGLTLQPKAPDPVQEPMIPDENWVSSSDLQDLCGLTTDALRHMASRGRLHPRKYGKLLWYMRWEVKEVYPADTRNLI